MKDIEKAMTKKINTINPDENIIEAAKILQKKKTSFLIIMEKGIPKGILTERDIVHKYIARKKDNTNQLLKVRDIMTSPIITMELDEGKNIMDAILRMNKYHIKKLGITKEDKLIGILCDEFLTGFCLETNRKP